MSFHYSFICNLDTKFCLRAAGGISVEGSFIHSGGNLSISGSSANARGGAMLMSFSWVFGTVWDGCRLWEINSIWIEEISMICHQCLRQSLIANWFMSWCFAVVAFAPYFSREQGGSLSAFLFLNPILIWNKIVDSVLMWLFMTCDVNDGVLLVSLWHHLACTYLLYQRINRIEQVFLSWQWLQNFAECNVARCAVLYFPRCLSITVSVAIWIPSSASAPQVGFMSIATSSTWKERSRFQGHQRMRVEVPCSWVFLGSLARFEMAVGNGRSTLS